MLELVKPGRQATVLGSRNPHLREARRSVLREMEPLLAKCERERLVLVNRYQESLRLTPSQLRAEWRKGRYIWGPPCWRLGVVR